jgi:predicted RNase H-like nuclease (RuvC/YqgF family)
MANPFWPTGVPHMSYKEIRALEEEILHLERLVRELQEQVQYLQSRLEKTAVTL